MQPNKSAEEYGNNNITVIFGRKRTGKTTFIREQLHKHKRVIIFSDIRNDFADQVEKSFYDLESFQVATMNGYWAQEKLCVRLKLPAVSQYNYAAAILKHLKHYLLVLDELDTYCSSNYLPSQLEALIIGSGNNSINILGAAKRPYKTPRLLTSQADHFVIFQTREKRDVDYVNEWVGEQPPAPYAKLAKGHFLLFDGDNWKRGTVRIPGISTGKAAVVPPPAPETQREGVIAP